MSIFDNLSELSFIGEEQLSIEDLENSSNDNQEIQNEKNDNENFSDNQQDSSLLDENLNEELKEFDIDEASFEDINEENVSEDNDSSSDESFSPVTSLASSLFEEGVLSSLTEDDIKNIKSGEDLISAVKKQIQENEFSDLTEEQREYLDAIRKGVSLEEFAKAKETYDSYNSITEDDLVEEDNKNLRFQLIKNSFLLKGIEADKAEKLTKRAFDLGEDVEDAKNALDELKDYEKKSIETIKKQKEEERKEIFKKQEEEFNSIKNLINTTEEVIPGLKVDENSKKAVEKLISRPFTKDKNGNQVNEVIGKMIEDKNYFVKLHYLHHITDGFTKFDKLVSRAKTQAVKSLEEKLKIQDARLSTGKQNIPSKNNEGLFKAINNFI